MPLTPPDLTLEESPTEADLYLLWDAESTWQQSTWQQSISPGGESGEIEDPEAADITQLPATVDPAPPPPRKASQDTPHREPKGQPRSSEENPGWVIRRN
jgi:hypothetical protein